ncbi:hypothetical protein [Calycomorphotria hydatis]|uniref:Heparinase II/III-like protein n=1 Tax=Calycomorphotria hydatis TaxID=2528027 RepID=A0A517TDT7_9PLAN|nr:hypothetical protein [Calycomorphotria hydatis]QDT66538.1 hypothetical protein V22_38080 [Calycomorphotria hydatis]
MSDVRISLETPWQEEWSTLPTDGLIEALDWSPTAPAEMTDAAAHRKVDQFWRYWAKYLQGFSSKKSQSKDKLSAKTQVRERLLLLLVQPGIVDANDHENLRKSLEKIWRPKTSSKKVKEELTRLNELVPDAASRALILAEIMRGIGADIDHELLAELFRDLLACVLQVLHAEESNDTSLAAKLIVQGELPWKAGLLFGPLRGSNRWLKVGRDVLREELDAQCDTDGTPHGLLGDEYTPWLASLVRAAEWNAAAKQALWTSKTGNLFDAFVSTAVKCMTPTGKLLLQVGTAAETAAILSVGTQVSGLAKRSPERFAIAALAASNGKLKSIETDIDEWSTQSDWSRVACLRNDWGSSSDVLAIEHAGPVPRLELVAGGTSLLQGSWPLDAKVGIKKVVIEDEWDCVCYHTDDDGEYVELYAEAGEIKFSRQLFLSRSEKFAVLFDSVLEGAEAKVKLSSTLPISEGVEPRVNKETREISLSAGKRYARLYPLGLPDRRLMSSAGDINISEQAVTIEAENVGVAAAPVLIDWHPRRTALPADWRMLTVAEEGKPVTPATAIGCRLRIGKYQLLLYRRYDESPAMRSVLGHHHNNETVIAEFDKDGDVEPLLLVE